MTPRFRPPGIVPLLASLAIVVIAPAAHAQRTKIITGPSAVYQRGFGPVFPADATFSYQAGYSAPMVVPNYAQVTSLGPNGSPRPVPYLSGGPNFYGNSYPGYGFGFGNGYGSGYGFGYGYGYGYSGYTYGYNSAGSLYPMQPMGLYGPSRAMILNGYYGR